MRSCLWRLKCPRKVEHETETKHLQIENCVWAIEFNSEDTLSTCLQVFAILLFVAHCFVCIISTRNFTLFAKRFLRNLWDFLPLYGFSFLPQARFLGPIDKQEMCLVIIPKTVWVPLLHNYSTLFLLIPYSSQIMSNSITNFKKNQ